MGKNRKTKMYKVIQKTFLLVLCTMMLIFWSGSNTWSELPNDKMDYHDYNETVAVLQDLRDAHPDLVVLKIIGHSYDIPVQGPATAYDIHAIRVGPVGEQDFQDGGDVIPSILFVGGLHGREWLGSESALELAQNLVGRAQDPGTPEYALLRRVAVWIIPIANPSGRFIDDFNFGDPDNYYQGAGNTIYGWRHSGDTRGCPSASDINRNFSTGWGTASDSGCGWSDHFEGLAPFSNYEAVALKKFVLNHWICMAVDVHTCSQRIWNTWGTGDRAGVKMKKRAVESWDRGLRNLAEKIYDRPAPGSSWGHWFIWVLTALNFVDKYTLDDHLVTGTDGGQFTAWLQEEQHVQAFVIELPPNNSRPNTDYYTSEFRYDAADQSNSFHPSSTRVGSLIKDSFIPMATYLIGQADAPGSATSIGYVFDEDSAHAVDMRDANGSYSRDFGILAAKIGAGDPGAPGRIESIPAYLLYGWGIWYEAQPAFDWLYHADSYELYYWVQNYSYLRTFSRCNVLLELKSRPYGSEDSVAWTVDASETRSYRLGEREKIFDRFPFEVEEDRDYELSVSVRPRVRLMGGDQFSPNNKKIFKFTTHWWVPSSDS